MTAEQSPQRNLALFPNSYVQPDKLLAGDARQLLPNHSHRTIDCPLVGAVPFLRRRCHRGAAGGIGQQSRHRGDEVFGVAHHPGGAASSEIARDLAEVA